MGTKHDPKQPVLLVTNPGYPAVTTSRSFVYFFWDESSWYSNDHARSS